MRMACYHGRGLISSQQYGLGFSYVGFFCVLEMKTILLKALHEKERPEEYSTARIEQILES